MSTTQLLLIDLSAIAHMIWHTDTNNPDPSRVSMQTIARVRALASEHPYAAVCCDSGRSFRADIDPAYKANRDTENRAPLRHQMHLACETLAADGFPVWSYQNAEADDIIATACREALVMDPDVTVLIASADKDLLQLVSERVRMKKITDGSIVGPAEVQQKFKVTPAQMHDYLCLVGDTSDNIVGAKGIGGVTAAKLLNQHGTIARIYEAMDRGVVKELTPALRSSMVEFKDRWPTVSRLIALKSDVPIPFVEIATERTAAAMVEEYEHETGELTDDNATVMGERGREPLPFVGRELSDESAQTAAGRALQQAAERIRATAPIAGGTPAGQPSIPNGADSGRASIDAVTTAGAVSRLPQTDAAASVPNAGGSGQLIKAALPAPPEVISAPPPPEWELQLEPRSYRDVRIFSDDMHLSRKFMRNFGTPQAIAATVVAGRELGVPAMAALRGFHSVEDGPPMPNADMVRGIILKSGKVEYFEPTERTDKAAEFAIKRHGRPEIKLRYTIEEGRTAYGFDVPMKENDKTDLERKWARSGWGKNPADMVVARASMKLGRLVCPDVCAGLYAPEEFD